MKQCHRLAAATLLSMLPALDGLKQDSACLCATDNKESFRAVMTMKRADPADAAPLMENRNASSYGEFQEGAGWEYVDAPGGESTYLYVWNRPLGFPSKRA